MATDKKNDGGPAFPVQGDPSGYYTGGLTLRDYFAGQAMGALASDAVYMSFTRGFVRAGCDESERDPRGCEELARHAYMVADAMLAERSK